MKTKVILKLWDMQMQIGQTLLLTCQILAKLEGDTFRPREVPKGLDFEFCQLLKCINT